MLSAYELLQSMRRFSTLGLPLTWEKKEVESGTFQSRCEDESITTVR